MSTTTNDSVVLGLDIAKTKKAISEDLKKVLKSIKPETLNLTDVDTRKITHAITEAIEKAYLEAASKLPALDVELNITDTSNSSVEQTTTNFKKFFDTLKPEISESNLLAATLAELKESLSELMQMDTVLTNLNKTGSLSASQVKELQEVSFDTASKYGKTATDYISSVKQMADAGFDNSNQMAELSLLAQTAGNMSKELSGSYLLAANSAYNLKGNVEELEKILDGQTSVAQKSQIQLKDMASATLEAADSASKYGIQAEELSALIAVASSNTMDSGTEIGNALSHIISSLHESDQLKNPIELLDELAATYQSLEQNSSERQSLLDTFGGSEHSDTLKTLLENWSSYGDMLTTYSNSSGAAMEAASKSADSWEGALNRLHNTWNATISNLADSEAITQGINLLNSLLSVVNHLTDTLGSGASLGALSGLAMNKMGIGEL